MLRSFEKSVTFVKTSRSARLDSIYKPLPQLINHKLAYKAIFIDVYRMFRCEYLK